jgi:ABC-2 type transport system permease protein
MNQHGEFARYLRVFAAFARNSLVRDMTFRANFIIETVTSFSWMLMQLGFYLLVVFKFTNSIGSNTGWGELEFMVFLATTMFINSLVQTFFMPNAEEFSESIRTGGLDFALLKPIDTQFLISLQKIEWSGMVNFIFGGGLLIYALAKMSFVPDLIQIVLYPIYIGVGVVILYSLTISLAATSLWLGRNQNLYDFWFYITNFSRYPMEIYDGRVGTPLRIIFTYVAPVLLVVNIPARLMAMPFEEQSWPLAGYALLAGFGSLAFSRWLFTRALLGYRSASS